MSVRAKWTTAWITGASTGIGRELALQLARSGVRVAASARSAETLDKLVGEQPGITAFPVDVTDTAAVKATAQSIAAKLGPIDLAIFNAGVWQPMGARNFEARKTAESMNVNYLGVCNGLEAVLPEMLARRAGQIALVSSVAGYRGLPKAVAYAPSKAAVISLAETLAPDAARYGVRISVVNPGFVETPMTAVNDFPMPFILKADAAASRIVRGLEKGKFEIAFPWQLVLPLKILRLLPYSVFLWYVRTFMHAPAR